MSRHGTITYNARSTNLVGFKTGNYIVEPPFHHHYHPLHTSSAMFSNNFADEKPYHMQFGQTDSKSDDELAHVLTDTPEEASNHTGGIKQINTGNIGTVPGISYNKYESIGKGLSSSASLTEDGKIAISLDLKESLPDLPKDYAQPVLEYAVDPDPYSNVPPMNIVIMIVGSRGDVQPYIVLSKALEKHGHRVRLATHETFRKMVREAGLEFFPIGGDPAELMSYMVRNPGLLPGFESLTNGDIPLKRTMVSNILEGCWKACHEPDAERGVFAADAIISNPPTFAHVHCAEALGILVHMSFTMPWCATGAFPHPLVVVNSSNAEPGLTNYLSYALADLLQWQGLGDIINQFRVKSLGLEPLSLRSGPSVVDRLRIPWTYCFSPTLIPKPMDWSNHIDVVGFYFLNGARDYTPDPALQAFLDAGQPPMYIGFGSVVVEDANAMTQMIFSAIKQANVRAIVSAGWGGLGGSNVPDNVFILPGHPGVPHDWLFTKVSAVCHHGGAGTTAIGLLLGKPTIIVPFFGDQPFWGKMVYEAGAGPEPIPQKQLTVDNLVAAFTFCETPQAKAAAKEMGSRIKSEDGPQAGVNSFHAHLPLLNMRCDIDPRPREYDTRKKTLDPLTGGLGGLFWTVTNCYDGITQIFTNPVKGLVNTTTALPRGFAKVLDSVQEGFHYVPTLYGSEIREVRPVTDWKSGMKEGGKGIVYGCYDGMKGLITEPVKGAKKEGFVGAMKGAGRGLMDVTMRPMAGTLGLVTLPTRGLWKTMQHKWATKQGSQLRETRQQEGLQASRNPNQPGQCNRDEIIRAFRVAKGQTAQRQEAMKQEGLACMQAGGGLHLEQPQLSTAYSPKSGSLVTRHGAGGASQTQEKAAGPKISVSSPSRSGMGLVARFKADAAAQKQKEAEALDATLPTYEALAEQDEASFEREMELATRLSLVEK